MKRLLPVIVLFILTTLITGLLLKFWVLKGMVEWLRCKRQQLSKLHNLKRRQHRERLRFNESMKNSSCSLKQMRL
ncbi:hypothetical protein Gotur_035336 [Gossypium turneri]